MIINSDANDIVYTAAVSGVNANFLKPSLEAMGITEDMWKNTKKIDFFWQGIKCCRGRG